MEKLLVTSIFSFSHNVFKRLLFQGHEKSVLCGKGLNQTDYPETKISETVVPGSYYTFQSLILT